MLRNETSEGGWANSEEKAGLNIPLCWHSPGDRAGGTEELYGVRDEPELQQVWEALERADWGGADKNREDIEVVANAETPEEVIAILIKYEHEKVRGCGPNG